jgi:hypothetical protein
VACSPCAGLSHRGDAPFLLRCIVRQIVWQSRGQHTMDKRPPKPHDREASPRHKSRKSRKASIMPKAAFEALARLTKQGMNLTHFPAFEEETRGNSNHRGSTILLITNVENALEYATISLLVQNRTDRLFGMDCPLGTFRNKIWMARALNIFGDETLHNLECMRHIRNVFAHAKIPVNFG